MTRRPDGHVSLLAQFLPREVREAARALAALLGELAGVVVTLDPGRGNLALDNVPGVDLCLLMEWLYRRGARGVFVRYQHEGWSPAAPLTAATAALN